MPSIGERIKKSRTQKKITQQELADQVHVSRSAISNWESSRNYPDLNSIVLLCDILDISLDNLLREDTKMVKQISNEQKKSKFRKIALTVVTTLLFIALIVISYLTYLNVDKVNSYFSPTQETSFVSKTNEWQEISIDEDTKYLQLKGPFWKKEITNTAGNPGTIKVNLLNKNGNRTIQHLKIKKGDSKKISKLKKGNKYLLKVKAPKGSYLVNIN